MTPGQACKTEHQRSVRLLDHRSFSEGGQPDLTSHLGVALSPLTPRLARAERVRARCCARLDRDRRRSRRLSAISRFARHVVAPAILAGLFAFYAADVIRITLRTLTS